MKKLFYPLAVALFLSAACSDDDDNSGPSASAVIDTVTSGNWRITSFVEDGTDHTTDFTNYEFTFEESGLLMAIGPDDTVSGAWSVDDDDSSPDFNIFFASPPDFEELTEDWDIVQRTDTKVRLRHESGGDGSIDTLTFEKN